MLELTEVTQTYGRGPAACTAVSRVSLTVAQGELVSIVGPSGCGKSTLLRCVAGLIRPTSGQVVLRGAPVTGVPDGLAVVLQDYGRSLYPWLSVLDNVAMPLRRTMRGRAARAEAAAAALAAVGLPQAGDRYPWQLSGGMQQRVAIARALACEPALLLMDEPFGSVDAQTREDLEDLVLRVRGERDITILVVTHDIDESVYLGDRVIVLTPGPGRVRAEVAVNLPSPRDQIETKEQAEFVRLRTEVSRLVRGREEPAAGLVLLDHAFHDGGLPGVNRRDGPPQRGHQVLRLLHPLAVGVAGGGERRVVGRGGEPGRDGRPAPGRDAVGEQRVHREPAGPVAAVVEDHGQERGTPRGRHHQRRGRHPEQERAVAGDRDHPPVRAG